MRFLHSRGIVHRDLKTLNILLDEFDDAYVADFGLSAVMRGNQDLVGGVGTPHYTAPKVLQHLRYNEKIDVYSYCLVLWELLTQKVPYAGVKDIAIFDHVVNRNWRLPIPKEAPPGLRKIISRCWSRNPNDRPTFEEIVSLFERHDIVFPQSQTVDLAKVNYSFRCPPLDFDCAFEVLKNPDHPRFASVCDFIGRRIDARTRERLRPGVSFAELVKATGEIDAVLLLASVLMTTDQIECFWNNGGLALFGSVLQSPGTYNISSAIRFALVLLEAIVGKITNSLPLIASRVDCSNSTTLGYIGYQPDRDGDHTIAEKVNERLDTKGFTGARRCLKNLSSIAIGPTLRHIYHSTVLRNVSGATPVPKCCIPPSRTHFTAPSQPSRHQMNGCPDVSGSCSLP
jgi:serine/threonine protein kinase